MTAQALAMDRMYRYQRHIYDLTRKYYLFGRDSLIQELPITADNHVLEIGCGTGRNLFLAARRHHAGHLYGLDASDEMLSTAREKARKLGYAQRITFRQGLAEYLSYRDFGLDKPFDAVFFSYTLSMIRPWQPAMDAALRNLKPGGDLFIVDFADQSGLPRWFASSLQGWLRKFGVIHDPALIQYLKMLQASRHGELQLHSIGKDYAFLAHFRNS
jgi:S-adenosylmethionine-diacylgycerolhomoserine-N-methlytransferase